ncbi:hypothetical protein [Lentzea flaviverrucosa]|nr:hypothetical protein [Lentzea flaviverrucosa]
MPGAPLESRWRRSTSDSGEAREPDAAGRATRVVELTGQTVEDL